jgi:hypothetical protein
MLFVSAISGLDLLVWRHAPGQHSPGEADPQLDEKAGSSSARSIAAMMGEISTGGRLANTLISWCWAA